jgi:tRNA modification GTPase
LPTANRLVVWTKIDRALPVLFANDANTVVCTSSITGEGLAELKQAIREALRGREQTSFVAGTADRCRDSLRLAGEAIDRALAAHAQLLGEELIAAELRSALDALGEVVGAIYTDDILDRVFSRFCIGK